MFPETSTRPSAGKLGRVRRLLCTSRREGKAPTVTTHLVAAGGQLLRGVAASSTVAKMSLSQLNSSENCVICLAVSSGVQFSGASGQVRPQFSSKSFITNRRGFNRLPDSTFVSCTEVRFPPLSIVRHPVSDISLSINSRVSVPSISPDLS